MPPQARPFASQRLERYPVPRSLSMSGSTRNLRRAHADILTHGTLHRLHRWRTYAQDHFRHSVEKRRHREPRPHGDPTRISGIDTACQPRHYHESAAGADVAACLRGGSACNNLAHARICTCKPSSRLCAARTRRAFPMTPGLESRTRRDSRSPCRCEICRWTIWTACLCIRLYRARARHSRSGLSLHC
jgi:hypothetical protein